MDLTIPEFFRDRHIFITGGTGFMGKVLIEKLVRSCHSISKIYLLVRRKKDKAPEERLKELTDQPIFERVKKEQPGALERILVPVLGDVTEKSLGLTQKDEDMLTSNVSVIFHVAASVRFDDPIKDAVLMNTRGTREVVYLAKKIPQLKVLLHVSTTYCNCILPEVDEKVYPMPIDWREAIDVVERLDPASLNILSNKYLDSYPNTYTFTKNLAEQVILEHKDHLPVIIFRPSIVISTYKEPMPGWIDNFNGPVGLLVGIGKGVIRTTMGSNTAVPDYMPVDVAIKAMIVAAWLTGTQRDKPSTVPVYNSSTMSKSISSGELNDLGMKAVMKYPFLKVLWYPGVLVTESEACFYGNVFIKHLLPGILIDTYLRLKGQTPILLKLYRRYYLAIVALQYFTTKSWKFYNKNFLGLLSKIHPLDFEDFDFNFEDVEPTEYFENAVIGGHTYLLRSDLYSFLPEARKNIRKMFWLDRTVKVVSASVVIWYLCSETSFNLMMGLLKRIVNIFFPLNS